MMIWKLCALLLLAALVAGCGAATKSAPYPKATPAPSSPPSSGSARDVPVAPAQPVPPSATQSAPGAPKTALPPGEATYRDYGVGPAVSAERQPTSTFAIDVDTASYTVARTHLERNTLPPPEAVRAEEFINFFPPQYAAPTNQAVAAYVEMANNPFRPHLQLVQISLRAREVERAERKPAMLTFVIDVSGSMNMENRLGLVKKSLHLLLDQLRTQDRVGIVVYGTRARTLLEHTSDKAAIRRVIDSLQPEGSTNAEEGLRYGYDLAWRAYRNSASNRIILLSDGVANVGLTGPEQILRSVEDYRTRGVYLTTIGFGMGHYNDALMEQLANQGDGEYHYVDTLEEARRVFVDGLTGTLETVAKDVKVQVRFDPEQVATWRLVGYENRTLRNEDFRNDQVDAGEMGAGHSVTALYEVQLRQSARSMIGSVTVRYKDVAADRTMEMVTGFDWRRGATGSARLRWTAAVAEFAGVLKGSPWAAETSLASIYDVADRAATELDKTEPYREFLELVRKARDLR